MAGTVKSVALVLLGTALWLQAQAAAELADPMRPPAAALADSSKAEAGTAQAQADAPQPLQALRLQAPQSRALLGGKWLAVGDSVGGARIVSIDQRGVRLRRDGVIETLHLLPSLQPAPGAPQATKP